MCGIIGIYCKPTCSEGSCAKTLHNGLKYMQNRGYDSAGIVTIQEKSPVIHKYASTDTDDALTKLQEILPQHNSSAIGLGIQDGLLMVQKQTTILIPIKVIRIFLH